MGSSKTDQEDAQSQHESKISDNSVANDIWEERTEIQTSATALETKEIDEHNYLSGWKLHLNTVALALALFTAQMESSIVSTSVLAITNQLKGFDKSGWIFTAYLVTYTGLIIIWAKLSDIYGRKPLLLVATLVFIVFSGACGASQTLIQLIIFRCIQGIGASGIFSLVVVVFLDMVPPRKLPTYMAIIMVVIMCSVTFGPLVGGAINDNTTWRWIFLLNVPLCTVSIVVLFFFLPKAFPGQHQPAQKKISFASLQRVDFLGTILLLGACVLIVTSMQQAAEGYSFSSNVVLPLLVFSGMFWIVTLLWQWFIDGRELPEPVFPWRFVTNRVYMGMILSTFFSGTLLTVLTIQIPQRFQTVNGDSALTAGARLIAFGILVPAGSVISSIVVGKTGMPPIFILLVGGVLEIVGVIGLSKTPTSFNVWGPQYVFQMIAGLGNGCFNALLLLAVPVVVEKRDLATGSAAITQFRVLGGTIGLAIVISVMNRSIRSDLLEILQAEEVRAVLDTTSVINSFPPDVQTKVRAIFGRGYNLQMEIMIGFAVALIPSTLLMWTNDPIMIPRK